MKAVGVVAVIALFALVDLVQAASGTLSALFRGALTALLAYHVLLGRPWARVVILALAAVSSLTVIPGVLMLMKLAGVRATDWIGIQWVTRWLHRAVPQSREALFLRPQQLIHAARASA